MLRNVYDWDCDDETEFWFVIKDEFGGIEELKSRTRNKVRKALKNYDYKRVDRATMVRDGLIVQNADMERRGLQPATEDSFRDRIKNSDEHWIGYDKETGVPAIYAINDLQGDMCNYSTFGANPKFMNSTYPYYGLLYSMNEYYLQECKLKYVCDGARSITEHSNIQPFLESKFNFRKAYVKMDIHYKWWFGLAVKLLYPFRRFIKEKRVSAILYQEWMARHSK